MTASATHIPRTVRAASPPKNATPESLEGLSVSTRLNEILDWLNQSFEELQASKEQAAAPTGDPPNPRW